MSKPDLILFLSDSRGIYIPRDFANEVKRNCVSGVDPSTWEILEAGPDHEWYWESWDEVLRDAIVTDFTTGVRYTVHQDGDCWLVPQGMEWNEAADCYQWPQEDSHAS